MDPRVAGAGVAMAVAMLMLLPTFNALNNSYDMSVPPPDWMPMPDELPEDFQPPEDMEYPEGWEPPPNMTPPPGWEPPPGYDGPIPPGGCPPPATFELVNWTDEDSWTTTSSQQRVFEMGWTPPKYTMSVGGSINFTNWRARSVAFEIEDPEGTVIDADTAQGQTGGFLLPNPTPVARTTFTYQSPDPSTVTEPPPEGEYTLRLIVDTPIDGSWDTSFTYQVACGGLLQ